MTDESDIKQFALRMPTDLLAQVDERAKVRSISRNTWFENMVRWVLVNTYTTDEGIQMGKEAAALAKQQAADRAL